MLSKTERASHANQKKSVKCQSKENLAVNPTYFSEKQNRNSGDITQRVAIIEQNLNRVCLQQDALMPLLNLLDFVPAFHKNESGIKSILRRIDEAEHLLSYHTTQLDLINHEQATKTDEIVVQTQIKDLLNRMGTFENQFVEMQENLEDSLEKFAEQLQEDKLNLLKQFQSLHLPSNSSDQPDLTCMEDKIDTQHLDIQNLYRELEGLKNENEFRVFKETQKEFQHKLNFYPKLEESQQIVILTHCEAERLLSDINEFEHSTNQRLQSQLNEIRFNQSQKPNNEQGRSANLNKQSTIQLKYSLAACKMKYYKEFEKVQKLQRSLDEQIQSLTLQASCMNPVIVQIMNGMQNLDQQVSQIAVRSKVNLERLASQIQQLNC